MSGTVRWPGAAFAAFLLAVSWLAYLPALHGGFVWDDAAHVTAASLRSLHGLSRIWFEPGATQQYYPLLHTAFWIEHRLWGDSVAGYHAINVVFHAMSAWLFWAVLLRLGLPGARVAALLFALHPVGVESVAWISEQKNTLSLVFYLAAALEYLAFDQERRPRRYALATLCFLLALLTKSVTATLPAALAVVIWWKRGRLKWSRDGRPLLPWLLAGAAMGSFTAWMERTVIGAQGADFQLTGLMRGLLAARALWFYLGKLAWPSRLAFIYPRWRIDPGTPWQYLFPAACAAALALLVALWLRKGRRGPLAAALIFAGTLFPALGFFNLYPFAYSYVADHFQYHASLAVFAAAAALPSWRRPLSWAGALAVLTVLAAETREQSRIYVDAETLYRVTLSRTPDCALAHNNLGVLLARRGGHEEAIAHYRAALRAKPDYPEAENNLAGELLLLPGRTDDALAHFAAAIRIRRDFFPALDNRANVLALIPGRWPDAERDFREAIRIRPDDGKIHNDYAIALSRIPGRERDALAEYAAAVRAAPDYAEARANYALELSAVPGRRREALDQYAAALALDPRNAVAHNNLANLLATLPGREAEAIGHYETALRLQPDYAEAQYNLANELAKDPRRNRDAISHYEAAVRLRPDYAQAHNNLAVAYAGEGRLAEAEEQFRLALKAQPDFAQARNNLNLLLSSH